MEWPQKGIVIFLREVWKTCGLGIIYTSLLGYENMGFA